MTPRFNLGQKVRYKNTDQIYEINEVRIRKNEVLYCFTDHSIVGMFEHELSEYTELKQKKLVKMYAPIIQHGGVYYTDHHYHSNKAIFSSQLNVVGFHEIEVEVSE
jgi:ABC-type uncharacterized transport system substrate-binding protein